MTAKDRVALTPPMGWNSWDCYGASVREDELLANARYMAEHMKQFGWEYIVCDIQWSEPGAINSAYRPFAPLCMDEYGRLIPAENRFPSSRGGAGFRPIADQIHAMGLKFGIHIMRGIPRQAVHAGCPVLGTDVTARDIAHPSSICSWNTDMYGVDCTKYGAQAYYDSIFALYASWGVDYVKVDDICVTEGAKDPYSGKSEIECIRRAIDRCGRPMVLSLSPGPALREQAEHLAEHANLWRMTGDLWDNWFQLSEMFDRCRTWQGVGHPGAWPDCDMLPLGHIGIRSVEHGRFDRMSLLTHDEQITMMTLFCLFRSPLMMGGELRDNDEWTLALLTNPEVLDLLRNSDGAREAARGAGSVIWTANHLDPAGHKDGTLVALFNTATVPQHLSLPFCRENTTIRDLWTHEEVPYNGETVDAVVPTHGAKLFLIRQGENF